MKKVLLPLLGILLMAGCEKEANTPAGSEADQALDFRAGKVTVCHQTGSVTNPYEIIEIADQSWVNAHMDHGDFLLPTWYADADGDGFGDPHTSTTDCVQPEGYVADNTDCDDTDADEFPGQTWYIDADEDGFGGSSVTQCERPANGYLLSELNENSDGTDDCDDTEATVYPGAAEICDDGLDNDCDGDVDAADSDCPTGCIEGEVEVDVNGPLFVAPADEPGDYTWQQAIDKCNDKGTDGCDWYLPNQDELDALYQYQARGAIGGFAYGYYWSSSSSDRSDLGSYAIMQDFTNGIWSLEPKTLNVRCRCVRR